MQNTDTIDADQLAAQEESETRYWQLVREVAASRPPLTGEQRYELVAIIRGSKVRRETERLLTQDVHIQKR